VVSSVEGRGDILSVHLSRVILIQNAESLPSEASSEVVHLSNHVPQELIEINLTRVISVEHLEDHS
jgi:hypothetical protein